MARIGHDTLKTRKRLKVGNKSYDYFSLKAAEKTVGDVSRLPFSMKVLLENLLRHEDGRTVTTQDIQNIVDWQKRRKSSKDIAYRPARVLMQDLTGVPAVVDLAAMRAAVAAEGGNPKKINPLAPVDLIIDHSVMIDHFGHARAFAQNVKREYERNKERYEFLKWGQKAFNNFRVVPPGTGICHQVNLEYLAQTVWTDKIKEKVRGKTVTRELAYPDTLVGTDSHTTMINGLAALGWGVGGIEAESAMLGQPISMLIPEVVGFKLTGKMREGVNATDLVLTVVEMLRKKGVVGKFVEFYGPGLDDLTLADRATIANMAPEYGATCGFFPIDKETINYLTMTGRAPARVALVEKYAKAQGMWRSKTSPDPVFTSTLSLDISSVEASLAGPKRPQDRVSLSGMPENFAQALKVEYKKAGKDAQTEIKVPGEKYSITHGDVLIAAITSCTNTSNPQVMIGAGLVARNAAARGLSVAPWVKTSLAPGSQVVSEYLEAAGLQADLNKLGFNLVGYGCTTCIGNSGPLPEGVSKAVTKGDIAGASVLSGNRNFEGRVNPQVKANYLASPMLVVAYAIAGTVTKDLVKEPLGTDKQGKPVFLKDIWPTNKEINDIVKKTVTPKAFRARYKDVFTGDAGWQKVKTTDSVTYDWNSKSTYIQHPPYFKDGLAERAIGNIEGARILALFGDSITTDHISPAGAFSKDSPAGKYLIRNKVKPVDFNSYGSRRGNHEVMMRGTFANIRIKNKMVGGKEGGFTKHQPSGQEMTIFDASVEYGKKSTPLIVVGGKEYGTGSSRDWAAKGPMLQGVDVVLVESFERIHRSNLVGMGVLPLQFTSGDSASSLKLDGTETVDILGLEKGLKPRMKVTVRFTPDKGKSKEVKALVRIDTDDEVSYIKAGGILNYVLSTLV